MTRIALMPSAYPPQLGGVEELTRHLALALKSSGDEVEIWVPHADDAALETVEIRDSMVVRRFPMPLPATNFSALRRSATTGSRTLLSLASCVSGFRPDVIHVQCFGPNGVYATLLSRLTGVPLVVTLQGETMMDDFDAFTISQTLQTSLRAALSSAAAVTACSRFTLADAEERFGLPRHCGHIIPNGVDLAQESSPDATAWSDRPGKPYLLALGRMVKNKGFDLLIEAYGALGEQRKKVDLVLGGAGAARADLEALVTELGLADSVHFVGRLGREQVAEAMAGAEALVMPSRLEPFGIVALEGWRAGVPVVVTNRGGAPEFVDDGVTGVVVDPFNPIAFARALSDLVDDAGRRDELARAGRKKVEAFDWSLVAGQYREIYATCRMKARSGVARRKGGPRRTGRGAPGIPTRTTGVSA